MCLRINPNSKFQKESSYVEDVNELIELAHQMSLIDAQIQKYVPNATKCMTWPSVQASHRENDKTVVFKGDDLLGVLVLIAMGLGGALMTWVGEMMIYLRRHFPKGKVTNNPSITIVAPSPKNKSSQRESRVTDDMLRMRGNRETF